jgi:uncharacterized membrane protein YccC
MGQTAKRTWSQQELAIKLHVAEPERPGWLSWERRRLLIHAGKTALAAALCWWIGSRFGLHDGYWGAISAIIVLQSNFGATITASRDRILGTVIGAVLGFSFSLLGAVPWNYILAVFAAIVICGLLGYRSSSRLACVTITIVMLVQSSSRKDLALIRVGQVVLGIVVAVAVSTLVFPDRARLRLREGLAQQFLLLGLFFEAILDGIRTTAAERVAAARERASAAIRANNQLLDASRNEPSGGPGWREGLAILVQFGHSLFDTLVALELAVADSHNDAYTEQLEPALGKLVADIATSFHFVAGCIHKWRFDAAPQGLHLEDDIAQLEERMTSLRPKGMAYSQAEILRAYALQLHLKQIARLLRASRVETSDVAGEGRRREPAAETRHAAAEGREGPGESE